MNLKKKIDKKNYKKLSQYLYFKTFSDPTYGFNVNVDVTNVVNYGKKQNISFFIIFIYLVSLAMNKVEEFHYRDIDDEIYYYDVIHPTFTVMSKVNGVFYNARTDLNESFSFSNFNKKCRKTLNEYSQRSDIDTTYNDGDYGVFYISCIPTLSIVSMTHPTPSNNHTSSSCPRVFWDKYRKEDDKYFVTLNITVSHVFVDGYPLSNVYLTLNEMIENIDKYLNN